MNTAALNGRVRPAGDETAAVGTKTAADEAVWRQQNEYIRAQFPILRYHPELVYLDSASTTLKPDCVLEAIADYYHHHMSNVSRGVSDWSDWANQQWYKAHELAGQVLGVSGDNIALTYSSTYAINLVAQGIKHLLQPGDVIVLSELEHNSNILPWLAIAQDTGAEVMYYDSWGKPGNDIEINNLIEAGKVKIVSYAAMSNTLTNFDIINEMPHIAQQAQAHGALVCVDATQAVAHLDGWELDSLGIIPSPGCPGASRDLSLPRWQSTKSKEHVGADFIIYSGHKIYCPTGIGVLYVRPAVRQLVQPVIYGSQTFSSISEQAFALRDDMSRFEPGTPNIEGAVGLVAGLKFFLAHHGQPGDGCNLIDDLRSVMKEIGLADDIVMQNPQYGIATIAHPGTHPHDIAMLLDQQHVIIRAGKLCADNALARIAQYGQQVAREGQQASQSPSQFAQTLEAVKNGVIRVSMGIYTNDNDIRKFVTTYRQAIDRLS